jgi:3-oxoacyl-[acyl-carrier-protein] synthase III
MSSAVGFRRFVALDEHDAPDLLVRMSKEHLPVDGERYGVVSRLIARPGVEVVDLAVAAIEKLCQSCRIAATDLGAVVLSSRIHEVQESAEAVVGRLAAACEAHGLERACSGFPAATELAADLCGRLQSPVALVTAEIMSGSINWEPGSGDLSDHRRARGQAAKLFGDGAAAVLLDSSGASAAHRILDAWAGEVPDEDQLIQKIDVTDSVDPWGHVRPGATTCMSMPGRRGFKLVRRAPQIMTDAVRTSVERSRAAGLIGAEERVTHVVPHQPNALILAGLQEKFSGDGESARVWNCIAHVGNTVSASIPLAMAEVQDQVPAGVLVAMPSVGAGGPGYRPDVLSTGCVLIRTGDKTDEADRN